MKSNINLLIEKIYKSQYNFEYKIPGPFGDRYITYADYIASGQPIRFIEEYIQEFILPTYANTHTEASFSGLQTLNFREEARQIIKSCVNANENDILLFCGSGTTGAIDLLIRKLTQFYNSHNQTPVVFIGPYEHHSNILPWREGPFELIEIPMSSTGNVDLEYLENKIKEYHGKKPIIGSFSAASNVTGIIAPLKEIHTLLKKYNGLSFWDFAGAAPYLNIDMNPEGLQGVDGVFISTHKLIGGPGSPGILIVKRNLFSDGLPVVTGGGTVHFVTKTKQKYLENLEEREEGGTPAILGSIRAGLCFKLKDLIGCENIEKIEKKYIKKALKEFGNHPKISVLGSLEEERLGFLAFNITFKGRILHHNFVVKLLNDLFGIQTRGGCNCAGPYGHDLLGLDEEMSDKYILELSKGNVGSKPGWVRLNFNYFIPEDEFDFIVKSILWISENGWKLLPLYYFDDDKGLWYCIKKYETPLNKLSDFLNSQENPKKGNNIDKKLERDSYFEQADKVAKDKLCDIKQNKLQEYKHTQLNNPLRWYSVAQDIEIETSDTQV